MCAYFRANSKFLVLEFEINRTILILDRTGEGGGTNPTPKETPIKPTQIGLIIQYIYRSFLNLSYRTNLCGSEIFTIIELMNIGSILN